jgi:anthranilate phosphoribosyltransferase
VPNPVLTEAIDRLAGGEDLSAAEAERVLAEVMEGNASEAQTAALLIALRTKGETVHEIAGLASAMRSFALRVDAGGDLVDTAGTGGGRPTFNVSTTAAFIAAGAGCRVAKHGNRSATSQCGSADVLEALGARIDLDPDAVAACIEDVGFGFMFAPKHHAAMKHVVPVRKDLAVRTIFNFLGPLTNPAGARRQLLGVSDRHYQETIAEALVGLGCERALVVCSNDGVDEIGVHEETRVIEVKDGGTEEWFVRPEDHGVTRAPLESIAGGTPDQNAAVVRGVFGGAAGAARDVVILNAAGAILAAGVVSDLDEGIERARAAVDSGAARDQLESLIETTRRLS